MFDLFLGSKAERFLKKAEKEVRIRIWKKMDELKLNPFPTEVVRVVGKRGKAFRVRIGDYRMQYSVFQDKQEIVVFDIDKRGRVYD